jgi:hypothetical protein
VASFVPGIAEVIRTPKHLAVAALLCMCVLQLYVAQVRQGSTAVIIQLLPQFDQSQFAPHCRLV